jgi:hypothetical protein
VKRDLHIRIVWLGFILVLIQACNGEHKESKQDIYPWQITVQSDGKIRVFGITLDQTTLLDASKTLGHNYELGLFETDNQPLSLEAYFSEVTLGGISGKFILTLKASQMELTALREQAIKRKVLKSGARRYTLTQAENMRLVEKTISSLAYIPYINLDDEIIKRRFGEPTERIAIDQERQHLLFPEQGLDLLLDQKGKELLQYVNPVDFNKLRQPLLNKYTE